MCESSVETIHSQSTFCFHSALFQIFRNALVPMLAPPVLPPFSAVVIPSSPSQPSASSSHSSSLASLLSASSSSTSSHSSSFDDAVTSSLAFLSSLNAHLMFGSFSLSDPTLFASSTSSSSPPLLYSSPMSSPFSSISTPSLSLAVCRSKSYVAVALSPSFDFSWTFQFCFSLFDRVLHLLGNPNRIPQVSCCHPFPRSASV